MYVTKIGIDRVKNLSQIHGVDSGGNVVISCQLLRGQMIEFFRKVPPCLIGMEACATSHYWARELTKLGHMVRPMPASYVKACVTRSNNGAYAPSGARFARPPAQVC